MYERRVIYFTRADLLEAVVSHQIVHGHALSEQAEIASFDPAIDEAMTLTVWRDLDATESITLTRAQVGAALIAHCQMHNVPLPKGAVKKLEKWRKGAALVVSSRALDVHVMVIDDQQTTRTIVRRLLANVNITHVTEAADGEDALEMLTQRHDLDPDVIICDLYMKKMDGVPFLAALRQAHGGFFRDTPVLILTSERKDKVLDVVRRMGASKVLNKPIAAQALLDEIRQVLGLVDVEVDAAVGDGDAAA